MHFDTVPLSLSSDFFLFDKNVGTMQTANISLYNFMLHNTQMMYGA
jgi:hypothetical protein